MSIARKLITAKEKADQAQTIITLLKPLPKKLLDREITGFLINIWLVKLRVEILILTSQMNIIIFNVIYG